MNELIWFSIPGAVVLFGVHLAWGLPTDKEVLVTASAPVLGYIIHQTYRTVFELLGGWESRRRPVLAVIREAYALELTDKRSPFLIWETAFYSNDVPETFRGHDRGTWHYVMSFRSVAFSALFAGILVAAAKFTGRPVNWVEVAGFGVVAVIFWLKSRLTYQSLARQECAAFQRYRSGFDTARDRISKIGTPGGPPYTACMDSTRLSRE